MTPRVPLPELPPGYAGNPFLYWAGVIDKRLYPHPPDGFKTRMAILFGLVGYGGIVALVLLVLNIVDYRRSGKRFWLYRLVKQPCGQSYIVGNLGLLEPLLTLLSCSVLLAHLEDEYSTIFHHAAQDQTGTWRAAPWSVLFFALWLTSWASLQAYILTSPDSRYVRFMTPRVANSLFLGFGGAAAVALVTLNILTALRDDESWFHIEQLTETLKMAAATWTSGPPDPVAAEQAVTAWSEYLEDYLVGRKYVYRLLVVFSITPFFTVIVNLGSIALLYLVRRQIKTNYSDLGGITEIVPAELSGPLHISLPTTSLEPTPTETSSSKESGEGLSRAHSQSRRTPSRAKIRRMAADEAGGVKGERARNLSQLHRAEVDLIITGTMSATLSVCWAILSIWVGQNLYNFRSLPWFAREAALLLGSWVWAVVVGFALSARVYVVWTHLSPRRGARRPSQATMESRRPSAESEEV